MAFNALLALALLLIVIVVLLLLRKPKTRATKRSAATPRTDAAQSGPASTVSRPSARGTHSAELPANPIPAAPPADEGPHEVPAELSNLHIMRADELDTVGRDRVATICANMPDPHPVQKQLAAGLDTPDALIDAVASDAGLTANILRTVNSAAFSLASPITSVRHAITYLGVSVVKGLVAQAAVAERAEEGTAEQQAALTMIWKSACTASAVAQMLAQELGVERPSVLATKALFFNLGDVALTLALDEAPAWYGAGVGIVERISGQQAVCSANAAIVGSELARRWNLPDDITEAIESGLLPLVTPPQEHPMQGAARRDNVLVYLAGRVGDRVTYGGLRNVAELDIERSEEAGLFYLGGHLQEAGLGRVPALLRDPAFSRKMNRLLTALAA